MSTISGLSGIGAAMPQAMSGASMRTSPQQKMSDLFQQIDTAGTGRITRAQFEQAFNSAGTPAGFKAIGLEAAFGKLDPNGTGSVSKQDFISGMKAMMTHGHHKVHGAETNGAAVPQTLANSINALATLGSTATPAVGGATGSTISVSA
ncbi:MAG: EF-hand domain-containing protein [Gallionellaceae bacterium]|nr:MAG: EF-hand domain-containing protein [Gallionellaceae bacterium]